QTLTQAIDSYNQRPEVQNVFRLLSAQPEPSPEILLSSLKNLNFSIMETKCPAHSGTPPENCDFKDDGLIKDCSAPVPQGGNPSLLNLTCVDSEVD
ncbi:CTHL1 protein, partial [Turnix velox]|nr:CTHL1 protein [Turnix velox]